MRLSGKKAIKSLLLTLLVAVGQSCSREVDFKGTTDLLSHLDSTEGGEKPPSETDQPPAPSIPAPEPPPQLELTAYEFDVGTSDLKPKTVLHLIVDNSNSMTEIHNTTASSLEKLMADIAALKLNVSINLLTTTDLQNQRPAPITIQYSFQNPAQRTQNLGLDSQIPDQQVAFAQGKGNSVFGPTEYLDVAGNKISNFDRLSPPERFFIKHAITQRPSLFSGGQTVEFNESLTPDSAATLANAVATELKSLVPAGGTTNAGKGAEIEQPISAIYRAALAIPEASQERHAFAIVTNGDDTTQFPLITSITHEIGPTEKSELRFPYLKTVKSLDYTYSYQPMNDGEPVGERKSVDTSASVSLTNCAATDNKCLPEGAAPVKCTDTDTESLKELARTKLKTGETIVSFGDCQVANQNASLELITNVYSDECDTKRAGATQTLSEIFRANAKSSDDYKDYKFVAPFCFKKQLSPIDTKSPRRSGFTGVAGKSDSPITGPQETDGASLRVGREAIRILKQKVGGQGFTVALVTKDGKTTCTEQGATAEVPSILYSFQALAIGQAPAERLRSSVCAPEYASISKGLLDFIVRAPVLEYPLKLPAQGTVHEVLVIDQNGQTIRQITDFSIQNGKIIFKPGTVAPGEKIHVKIPKE
ncbi:MAG: hypothetical protein RIQ81_1533 [Pseudomonadota bacterium]|jgi:hypothetical protein